MAPVSALNKYLDFDDLKYSSLELDARSPEELTRTSLNRRHVIDNSLIPRSDDSTPILSPMDSFRVLTARDAKSTNNFNPGAGSVDPEDINMKGLQALFAIIGVSFVLGAIWFFFWAKNGGFKWRKGDWEEYKSTVLRRKGPNGTTLSNATKSTILGGGSVVGDGYSDKDTATNADTMTETMTELSSEAPILKKSKATKETAKERKLRQVNEASWEGGHDNDVRNYRHEKPARVGGLNKDSDAQFYGTDYSATERSASDMNSNYSYTVPHSPHSRQSSPDKRQNRRDFSYGQENTFNAAAPSIPRPARYHSPDKNTSPQRPIRTVPGSFTQPLDFDVQSQHTRAYHHPIPGLAGQGKTGGYRRDRGDDFDE
ncbi:hypothetical protein LTR67_007273 [Exophiala xenobiotica]